MHRWTHNTPAKLLDKLKRAGKYAGPSSARKSSVCSDTETASFDSGDFGGSQFSRARQTCDFSGVAGSHLNSVNEQKVCAKRASDKYKTELCKNYDYNGHCKWGDACFFAHGKHELKCKVLLSQFYKTKVCKHFHRGGFCPYASRCQYFHFKPFAMHQELCDSYVKKLTMKVDYTSVRLDAVLTKSERVQKRLTVFQNLHKGDCAKSLQEKFLDNEF